MRQITLHRLQSIMRECAGENEDAQPLADAANRTFEELGYDSLALLETQSRIHREFGVALPDEAVVTSSTPQAIVDHVNGLVNAR
ncbi:acyl carrier protein [Micromonospora sp. B11E3]|uniref:acyl carrier protein n=1 Tax=Micromonospora sp. B11E3 TaxID=3153562 RepID=UPI00325DC6EF